MTNKVNTDQVMKLVEDKISDKLSKFIHIPGADNLVRLQKEIEKVIDDITNQVGPPIMHNEDGWTYKLGNYNVIREGSNIRLEAEWEPIKRWKDDGNTSPAN